MRQWTIRRRIVASFGVVLVLIFVLAVGAFFELSRMVRAAHSLQLESMGGLQQGELLESAWYETYLLAQQFTFLDERAAIEQVGKNLRSNHARLNAASEAYSSTIADDEDRRRYSAFQQAANEYLTGEDSLIASALTRQVGETRAILTDELAPRFAAVQQAIRAIDEWNVRTGNASASELTSAIALERGSIIAALVAIFSIALIASLMLGRAITHPLQRLVSSTDVVSKGDFTQRVQLERSDEFGVLAGAFNRMVAELTGLIAKIQKSAIQVNTSVTQIGATATEHQATATEIAATTTEIGATSREISATSRELVSTMSSVSAGAEQTAVLAGRGQDGLIRMEDTMRNVADAAVSISAKLGVLSEKANNITQVVTTITKVADQTNLLSLNAAIEAEKAGEAGRGFAVVATEIRRLADQTAVASLDIERTVEEIQSAAAAGVMGMDKFSDQVRRGLQDVKQVSDQLTQIIQQVQVLAPRFIEVNEGMQAQATGAEQISDALTQLTEASQQTVQSLRQSTDAIGGLNEVAHDLRGAVSRFKLAS
jgi:methyl-accepting chemotaxis protein WspA